MKWASQKVIDRTEGDYFRYWKRWVAFLTTRGMGDNPFLDYRSSMKNVISLVAFMDHEHSGGCDVKKGMTSLRHFFVINLRDTSIFDSKIVAACKKGMGATSRVIREGKVKRTRLPTPFIFVAWLREGYWQEGTIDDRQDGVSGDGGFI